LFAKLIDKSTPQVIAVNVTNNLKKIIKISLIIIFFNSTLSCNQQIEVNEIKSYDKIALEFITQIFSNELEYECSSIIKPSSKYNLLEMLEHEMPDTNYRNRLIEALKIKQTETLDSLLDLSKDFEFQNSMFNKGTELIDINQFSVIKTEGDSIIKYGSDKEIEQYFTKCPSVFYFISKPVFDKEYKTAVIDIRPAFLHLRSGPWIFELNNGIWESTEQL
jgi:hypothetical protein